MFQRSRTAAFGLIASLLLVAGNGLAAPGGNGNGKGNGGADDGDAGSEPAPYLSFAADRTEIASGESVLLSWASLNTKHCFASGSWDGKHRTEGSYTTGSLTSNAAFTLECKGNGTSVVQTVQVQVSVSATSETTPASEPSLTFGASAESVLSGDSVTLSWTAADADSCAASGGWSGTLATSGSQSVGPIDAATTYALSCTGAGGSVSDSVTVDVQSPAPTLALSTADAAVTAGGSTTLSWSATDADTCTASGGWSGTLATSGSQSVGPIDAATTYALSCTGAGGSVSDSVTVDVAMEPTVALDAADGAVAPGSSTTLSWSSTDAHTCTASGGWSGDRATAGTATVGPIEQSTTYSLSCDGAGGSAVAMVSVAINDTVTLSWQAPTENTDGTSLTDLSGYRIYYGMISGAYTDSMQIDSAGTTSYSVQLDSGEYFFAMTAVDADGNESAYSNEVIKVVP